MIRTLFALFLFGAGLSLAACNTVRGLGQDIESVANEVDEET